MPTRDIVLLLALAAAPLAAQQPPVPLRQPRVAVALARLQSENEWTLDQQKTICEIPAPPFKEAVRAAELKRRFESHGLRNVRLDAEGNVLGERPGSGGPTVVISGHLDTVFPEGTDVRVKREGTVLRGPGIGDDCRGLAVILAVARAFDIAKLETAGTVIFVGTVGEEAAGNLRGVRHLFAKELAGKVDYFISVDGIGLRLTSGAVGSNRYRVTFKGPGGHSFNDFGMPNPLHALGRAVARIGELRVPDQPKTTFSVGIVAGGTSVNAISTAGSMDVDLRSESPQALSRLDARFREAVAAALREENARWPRSPVRLTVEIRSTGIRPAGIQPDTARIVRAAIAAGRALGFTPPLRKASTDANLPMSLRIPAVMIDGGGSGAGDHSLDEYYDDGARGHLGPQWAALLVATLAGVR